jgi:hypothetical protein
VPTAACSCPYDDVAFGTLSSMSNPSGVQWVGIEISLSEDETTDTIVVAATTMESIPNAFTAVEGGFRWELHVGVAELLPVGDLNYFDAVPHETKVMLEQTFFTSFVVEGCNIVDVEIPTSSIALESGGTAIGVSCTADGMFSGQPALLPRPAVLSPRTYTTHCRSAPGRSTSQAAVGLRVCSCRWRRRRATA